ncbi:MAG TPA: YhcH/YjgK/YiaL family protein [Opitutaceae bacterium]|nr:YhcH/YjgK/YiaL family protein [Opitutaceae bacterium]
MAMFGSCAAVRAQCAPFPELRAALDYAVEALTPGSETHARIAGLAGGTVHRHELGGGAHAIEMAYETKRRPEAFFETHRKFIDVQVMVAGEELMEVAPAARLTVVQAYEASRDLTKYADTDAASVLRARAADVAVFWPEDAHMPALAVKRPQLVRKTVVKVPVSR